MQYKYCFENCFEDFAAGRVIIHKSGYTNYPVRLAQEIFQRCLSYLEILGPINLYDPCCGGGYLLTVLGFLNYEKILGIFGSDINKDAIDLARSNLNFLTNEGINKRIEKLTELFNEFKKESHREAIISAKNLKSYIKGRETNAKLFKHDILKDEVNNTFEAHIVFADVPYGNLVSWESKGSQNIDSLLNNIKPVLKSYSIIAISCDKLQKIYNEDYTRLEKLILGKRKIEILKLK